MVQLWIDEQDDLHLIIMPPESPEIKFVEQDSGELGRYKVEASTRLSQDSHRHSTIPRLRQITLSYCYSEKAH